MPARVWTALAGRLTGWRLAVGGLAQWRPRRGGPSLSGPPWRASPPPAASAPVLPRPKDLSPPPAAPSPGRAGALRIAVIVDDLGARRDVFDGLREIRRPLTVAVLPGLPLSEWTAREATQSGMEVLLDLPMEPYRYPEVDPGPGALLMAMTSQELQTQMGAHLASVPGAVGVTNHMGSRMTEDRARMRTVLDVMAGRRLFLVDGLTSNLSVAYDEAKAQGLRAGRRQVTVDHMAGEAGGRGGRGGGGRGGGKRGGGVPSGPRPAPPSAAPAPPRP